MRGDLKYKVTNILGKIILEKQIFIESGQNALNIDVSKWNNGLYYVVFEFEGLYYMNKIMVIH